MTRNVSRRYVKQNLVALEKLKSSGFSLEELCYLMKSPNPVFNCLRMEIIRKVYESTVGCSFEGLNYLHFRTVTKGQLHRYQKFLNDSINY